MRITGSKTELTFVADKCSELAKKKLFSLSVARMRDEIRNRGPLKGMSGLAAKLKDEYIPELQKRGYIVQHNDTIYINPKLA
jgi:hypothetical protein